jgi:hypothetical protein
MSLGHWHLDSGELEETRIGNYSDQAPTAPNFRTDLGNAFDGREGQCGAPRFRIAFPPRYFPNGFVTLPCREREVSAPRELSGRSDCSPPRGHRDGAKRAVRAGGDEVALDVEGIVDGGVCGKKLLG